MKYILTCLVFLLLFSSCNIYNTLRYGGLPTQRDHTHFTQRERSRLVGTQYIHIGHFRNGTKALYDGMILGQFLSTNRQYSREDERHGDGQNSREQDETQLDAFWNSRSEVYTCVGTNENSNEGTKEAQADNDIAEDVG